MERGEIDRLAFRIEMAAPQRAAGMRGGERERTIADVGGVLVVDHRALAARIVDQPLGDPDLEHALPDRRVPGGVRERVPGAESHTPKVASGRGVVRPGDPWRRV